MTSRFILAGLLCASLSGCALYAPSSGNPNGDAYLGKAASVYEASVNPARTVGVVSYNPSAPMPEAAQPSMPSGAAMMPPPAASPAR